MVDILALALSHGLLLLAAWRLLWRPELDDEGEPEVRRRPRPAMRVRPPQDEPDA
jgi:hypothetical protein